MLKIPIANMGGGGGGVRTNLIKSQHFEIYLPSLI